MLEIAVVAILVVGIVIGAAGNPLSLEDWPVRAGEPGLRRRGPLRLPPATTFEATTVFSEEARNPRRTIPLALYAVILFVAIFCTVATWAVSFVGPDLVQQAATDDLAGIIFGLAATYVGPWLDVTMQVLVVSSFIAMLIGMQNMFARYGFALARAGVLPEAARSSRPALAGSGGRRLANGIIVAVIVTGSCSPGPTPSRSSTRGSSRSARSSSSS